MTVIEEPSKSRRSIDAVQSSLASDELVAAVMLLEPGAEQYVKDVLRGLARVAVCRSASTFLETLKAGHVDLIVCTLANPRNGKSLLDLVLEVRTSFPNTMLAVTCPLVDRQTLVRDLLTTGRAHVDAAFVLEGLTQDALYRLLVQSRSRAARRWVAESLARSVPPICRSVWLHVLGSAQPLSAHEIARLLGMKSRTLRSHLAAQGLPSIGELALWARLLAAARLLDEPRHSAARAAQELGFGSVGALRSAMKRHVGMTPAELRIHGGVAPAVRAFFARIAVPKR